MQPQKKHIEVSVVCPIYDEVENVPLLLEELKAALESSEFSFEVLCVDDCSSDGSLRALQSLQQKYAWLRIVAHQIRSGQSAAILTGYQAATGEIVVSMDADLQYNAGDIIKMVRALKASKADAITGIRQGRKDSGIKKLSSKLANAYRNLVTGDNIQDAGCAFRAVKRDALREVPAFNGLHRFLPTILRAQGFTVDEIEVEHRTRIKGISKYGINNRLWRGLADCLAIRWYKKRAFASQRIAPKPDK